MNKEYKVLLLYVINKKSNHFHDCFFALPLGLEPRTP